MKEKLIEFGFSKIPNSNLLQMQDTLIYLTKADLRTRTFSVEEFNIHYSSLENHFEHVFILVEIEKPDKYLLIEKSIENPDFGIYRRNKIGTPIWKYRFDVIPAMNEDAESIAVVQNIYKLNDEKLDTEVLLDEESIFCILSDYVKESVGG